MRAAFETIRFFEGPQGVRGLLLKYFSFTIPREQLLNVGPYTVVEGAIEFDAHDKKYERFMGILSQALKDSLVCTITKNPATYIDQTSRVPLINALEFGIIDRGSNLIEIRPCSGCNLACTYCSVHEGPGGPKKRELVIEKDYLVDAFAEVAAVKTKPMEVFIETQGEPLLYADLAGMIRDLRARYNIVQVTMVTNGTFLTAEKAKELKEAGLDRINWSINSLDPVRAREIAGAHYDIDRVKRLILEVSEHIPVLMCPVIMKGVNDDEMEAFVEFAKTVKKDDPIIGFQNFLYYKGGRNPVDEMPWEEFRTKLSDLEKKHGVRLSVSAEDFSIVDDASLPKPFKKKQVIEVEKLFAGRMRNEWFCHAQGRVVKVIGHIPDKERFSVQLIRDKHNIYVGKAT